MGALQFKPWIGAEYAKTRDWRVGMLSGNSTGEQGSGFPVHVMGESHYGTQDENTPDNTLRIMEKCAFAPSDCSRFFTKLANLFVDAASEAADRGYRRRAWDRLAFSNYIQEVLPDLGIAPNGKQLATAEEAFFEQLRLTAPTILLVVSYRLWQSLPVTNCVSAGHISCYGPKGATLPESRVYTCRVGNTYIWTHAICVPHPRTSAFRRSEGVAKLLTAFAAQGEVQERFCSFDEKGSLLPPRFFP